MGCVKSKEAPNNADDIDVDMDISKHGVETPEDVATWNRIALAPAPTVPYES